MPWCCNALSAAAEYEDHAHADFAGGDFAASLPTAIDVLLGALGPPNVG